MEIPRLGLVLVGVSHLQWNSEPGEVGSGQGSGYSRLRRDLEEGEREGLLPVQLVKDNGVGWGW